MAEEATAINAAKTGGDSNAKLFILIIAVLNIFAALSFQLGWIGGGLSSEAKDKVILNNIFHDVA